MRPANVRRVYPRQLTTDAQPDAFPATQAGAPCGSPGCEQGFEPGHWANAVKNVQDRLLDNLPESIVGVCQASPAERPRSREAARACVRSHGQVRGRLMSAGRRHVLR
jgi:hypothetical protein